MRALSRNDRTLQAPVAMALAGGLIASLLSWRIGSIVPIGGIDGSWRAGLAIALEEGFRYGPEVLFTYGPLGTFSVPQLYDPQIGALAWLMAGLVQIGLCVIIAYESWRAVGSWIRAVPLLLIGATATTYLPTLVAVTCIAMYVLVRVVGPGADLSRRTEALAAGALGAAAGVLSLVKLNDGLTIVAVTGLTAIGMRQPYLTVPAYGIGMVSGALVGWLGTGQRLSDLPSFMFGSWDIISGYPDAMALPNPDRGWQYLALGVVIVIVVFALRSTTLGWRPLAKVAIYGAMAVVLYTGYRHGFVRQIASGLFASIFIIVPWLLRWDRSDIERRLWVGAVLGMVALASASVSIDRLRPFDRVGTAIDQLVTIVDTERRVDMITEARARLRSELAIPPAMLETIGRRSVHIGPTEASVAWAYPGLRWAPLPVMQQYQAYTPALDEANAERLESPDGPDVVLRHATDPIEGRSDWYEAPRSALALICNFRVVLADRRWQLLERAEDRCSAPRTIKSITARPGERIEVPQPTAPDQLVLMHVLGVNSGGEARLRTLFGQPSIWSMALTDVWTYRLVPATASGPMIVGRSTDLGHGRRFRPPPTPDSVTITAGDAIGQPYPDQPDSELQVLFETVDIAP